MSESFTTRRGMPDDAFAIAEQRRLMVETMDYTDPAQLDTMCTAFIPWVTERLARGDLAWLVLNDQDMAVSDVGLWLRAFPPNPGDMCGRRGFAKELVWRALKWCRDNGIHAVTLTCTDAGRPIYESLGFAVSNSMLMWSKDTPSRDKT